MLKQKSLYARQVPVGWTETLNLLQRDTACTSLSVHDLLKGSHVTIESCVFYSFVCDSNEEEKKIVILVLENYITVDELLSQGQNDLLLAARNSRGSIFIWN